MKKTDIAMIVLIAIGSVTLAFFVTRAFLGDPNTNLQKAPTMLEVTPDLAEVDPNIFNKDAINPAIEVQIDGANQ